MGEYSTVPVIGSQITRVQGSSIIELERNMNAALSAIAANRVVTAIRVAGSGQGHMFTLEIEHGVGQGYDPDDLELRCYMATGVRELGVQYTAAVARVTAGMVKVDTISMGASDDLVSGAILVYADAAHREPTNLWLAQATWHINATTGSDQNTGLTAGTALASHAEFERRLGDNPSITQATTVYIESDLAEVLRLKCSIQGTSSVYLRYLGVPTAWMSSSVVAAYTASAVGVESDLTCGTIANWTTAIGRLIRFTSGDANGGCCFVSALQTAGADHARVGIPMEFNASAPDAPFQAAGTPANPDTFVIEILPVVLGFDFEVARTACVSGGGSAVPSLICEKLDFYYSGGQAHSFIRGSAGPNSGTNASLVAFGLCRIRNNITAPNMSAGASLSGCNFASSPQVAGGSWLFKGQAGGNVAFVGALLAGMAGESYFDGGGVRFVGSGTGYTGYTPCGFGVYDSVAYGISVDSGAHAWLSANWGANIATYGLVCDGYVTFSTVPTIAGLTNDVIIGGNAMAWAAVPHKNCLPSQAQWTGGAAAQGTDDNDYHVIQG